MQYFNVSYGCSEGVRGVTQWLKESNEELKNRVLKSRAALPRWKGACRMFFVVCLIGCAAAADRKWYGIAAAAAILGLLGIIMALVNIRKTHRKTDALRTAKRAELEAERDQDPFFRHARLIAQANEGFNAHGRRYWLHLKQVREGLRAPDEALEQDYLSFLERADELLTRASKNFLQTADLAERRKAFEREHPEVHAKPQDGALSDLMAQLNEPANTPRVPELPDAREALEYEQALQELNAELHGEAVRQA